MQRQEKYAQISLHYSLPYFLEVPFLQESGYSLVVACLCDHTVPTLYSAGVMNMHDQTCFPLLLLFVHVFPLQMMEYQLNLGCLKSKHTYELSFFSSCLSYEFWNDTLNQLQFFSLFIFTRFFWTTSAQIMTKRLSVNYENSVLTQICF